MLKFVPVRRELSSFSASASASAARRIVVLGVLGIGIGFGFGLGFGPGLDAAAAEGGRGRGGRNNPDDVLPTPEEVARMTPVDAAKAAAFLKEVKFPPEFDVSIFATSPAVNYPVFVAAAPDGTLYVSSDGNGSLDRKEHRGRILRVRDLDGDGRADEVKVFVPDVDSPRGLVWDHDRLYLLHPPHISEFIDRDGDGRAETNRVLVSNIAFGFKDRPADHSSNGLELGVDGWLYAAIGDFGFVQAEGTDGRRLQLRGGGVVRVRPDGTALELWARGTRNILEVAVSPLLDAFARDNTNDGGGWDVRFHHFTGFEDHGYPRLFKNFAGEAIAPLADYGGGSGCGAAWIDEPGVPAKWNNAAFTADWGRNWVYRHGLTPQGATFTVDQNEFIGATRVTDLDVDALSRVYVASWKGATFTWAGNEVGYLVQARPKSYTPAPVPNFDGATDDALLKLLESPSHRTRLEAQRTLLRQGFSSSSDVARALAALAGRATAPLASRVAAVFALEQGLGAKAQSVLESLASDASIRAWAIRALGDQPGLAKASSPEPFLAALTSTDARTRREAVAAVGRWHGLTGAAADGDTPQPASFRRENLAPHAVALLPRLTDRDPVVAHTALQVLRQMRAGEPILAALDQVSVGDAEETYVALLRVLAGIPEPVVVDGLQVRLAKENDPARRRALLTALCRLHFVEARWTGSSWGTRPDTRGPLFQPEPWSETARIAGILTAVVTNAAAREAIFLAGELERHRIVSPAAAERLLGLADSDPSVVPIAISQLARSEQVAPAARPLLQKAAREADTTAEVRAQAIVALTRSGLDDAGLSAALAGLARLPAGRGDRGGSSPAVDAFLNAVRADEHQARLETVAAGLEGQAGSVWADAALIRLADRARAKSRTPGPLDRALDQGWENPGRRRQLIEASSLSGQKLLAEKIVAAVNDADASVSEAARQATRRLRLENSSGANRGTLVSAMKTEEAIAAALNSRGTVGLGEEVFTRVGCVACHTVRADDPLKGPFLGNIATIYKRRELAEAVLVPNKSIAQGFAANRFELKNGDEVEGFVVQEAADLVTVRNVAAQELKIKPGEIARREKLEKSLMPEGLAAGLTVREFASLLDYLESLAANSK
jgi:putative membrane-bound dehydrogenase-like protein